MNRPVLVLVVIATLAVAGCLGGGGSDSGAASSEDGATGSDPGQTGDTGSGDGDAGGGDADGHANATLEEPPSWEVGSWWTAEVTDVNKDETYTVTQVVASQHGSSYDVGLAKGDFSDPVVIAHWPPIGELGTDLSYPIHNEVFKPVTFPLEEGQSWSTSYLGASGFQAKVAKVDGKTAEITMRQADTDNYVNLTYDAEMETITKLTDYLGLTYEVTDHGHGYEGDVVVPHGKSQYIAVKVAGAFDVGGPIPPFGLAPAPNPQESVDVAEPQASAALLATGIAGAPGYYEETATTPGDTSATVTSTGSYTAKYLHAEQAEGSWSFQHVAGGAGFVGTEIVAYEKLTVTLGGDSGSS
jgi:hypothetical protein